jgi:hypothetical protein
MTEPYTTPAVIDGPTVDALIKSIHEKIDRALHGRDRAAVTERIMQGIAEDAHQQAHEVANG